ncbi:hypothetical protein A2W24_06725 [Microgenomates group bacterium RBG_16_45_19]|nr:MAG: hypothetical protein A2W24_06725 [Microgenomates group bacterium RBG_16_45_19]
MTYTLTLRPKRQLTLPQAVIETLGVNIGDQLTIKLQDQQATLIPNKDLALNALKVIQQAFTESKITESDMQALVQASRHRHN